MLGWNIAVYRLTEPPPSQTATEQLEEHLDQVSALPVSEERGNRMAVWQTGIDGLRWLDELVGAGKAVSRMGSGYPSFYFARARDLAPQILQGPPCANAMWMSDPNDVLTSKWEGKTKVNRRALKRCGGDEWLLVEAWDES